MRNLKKFLALVLAMMMALSLMVTVNASTFKDDDQISDIYADAVSVLEALGVVRGDDGFRPQATITRAEVAALLYRITTGDVDDDYVHLYKAPVGTYFTDVRDDAWYNPYVNYCANNGLVQGVGNNRYAPSNPVTGYETLVMVLRAIGYNNPSEFSSSDWRFKASGYGSRLGLTANVATGALGGSATREVVTEIMFKALQAPTVYYSPLTLYTPELLVDANAVNEAIGDPVYAADVPNTLMYEVFGIVGERTILERDEYGRPVREWVEDLPTDTIENGGKYIVNPQLAYGVDYTAGSNLSATGGGVQTDENVYAGHTYIPYSLYGASYVVGDNTDPEEPNAEDAVISITMKPVYEFYDVLSECVLMQRVNGDRSINASTNLTEWLNGAQVKTRIAVDNGTADVYEPATDTAYTMDALHTATGDGIPTVGAPGRTTEVYITDTDARGTNTFVFVYIDTLLGTVSGVAPRTYDTAGHVMSAAELHIRVNDTANDVVYTSRTKDFTEYASGDRLLLTTYGGRNWTAAGSVHGFVDANTGNAATGQIGNLENENVQTTVPAAVNDFLWRDGDTTTWAVDIVGKPTTATFEVYGTTGTVDFKTGLMDANGNQYPGNVVYLANNEDPTGVLNTSHGNANTPTYYFGLGHNDNTGATYANNITTNTTVPSGNQIKMNNTRIAQTVTAVCDPNGYVVGLSMSSDSPSIGVVTSIDSAKIGTGAYAIEAELFMIDGSTLTARFLNNGNNDGGPNAWNANGQPFTTESAADTAIQNQEANCGIQIGAFVQILPFTYQGETYYRVTATDFGTPVADVVTAKYNAAGTRVADNNNVETGVADTLNALTVANTANAAWTTSFPIGNQDIWHINDNTRFIIAERDYRYNQGNNNNAGSYTPLTYSVYTGFKTIPTVQSNTTNVKYQKIGNNVYIYPDNTANDYTIVPQKVFAVDDTYLVLAPIATYADHATYKVLYDGIATTLDVVNNNLTDVNNDLETAMRAGQLVYVNGWNSAGYATSVEILDQTGTYNFETDKRAIRTIAAAENLSLAAGVLCANDTACLVSDSNGGSHWLTVDDSCDVYIVNLLDGSFVRGSLNNFMQYETYTGSHQFVYELNEYGYISVIYIID